MRSEATSVDGYLASLTPERRAAIATLRELVREALQRVSVTGYVAAYRRQREKGSRRG